MSDLLRCLNKAMYWKQFLLFKRNQPTTCSAAISRCSPRLVAPLKLSRVEPGQIPITDPGQSWPPNNPHPLDWLYLSLSSPPVAGVWWVHWRRCPAAAVTSSKWMLHTGGGSGESPPHMNVKCFGCTAIHNKALYKMHHSFFHPSNSSVTWWPLAF